MAKRKIRTPKGPFLVILAIVTLVVFVSLFKIMTAPQETIYVKVKLSQGFWWAATSKPNLWFAKAIKKGETEKNLMGKEIAKILEVRYYPYFSENLTHEDKYDVYLTVALSGSKRGKTGEVVFKRQLVSVGSPIEFSLPSAQITGTIIGLSKKPFEENSVEKTVHLTKRFAYPWEFEAIKVGDTYFDGKDVVFEVLGKTQRPTAVLSADSYGNLNTTTRENTKYIIVKAKIKAKIQNDSLVFGEEKVLTPGSPLPIATNNFVFENFIVSSVKN